jgi:uncharacterized membrane protein
MKMKRIMSYTVALLVMFVFAACGGGGDDDFGGSGNSGGNSGGGGSTHSPQTYTQSVSLPAKGGEQIVTLSNLSSAVSSVSSTPTWLVISPQFYSSGAPTLKLAFQENEESTERNSTVTVLAASGDKVELTIVQQAAEVKTGIDDIHSTPTDQPAYSRRH